MTTDRRLDGERRTGERIAALETNDEAQDRTLEAIAPVAVHLAEMNVKYAGIHDTVKEIKEDLDGLHPRIRKLEYAVIALGVAAFSPKLGGPALPDVVTGVISFLT